MEHEVTQNPIPQRLIQPSIGAAEFGRVESSCERMVAQAEVGSAVQWDGDCEEEGEAVKYQAIYADPPWQYADKGCNGNAEGHYSTMKLSEIKALPVEALADTDAVLLMWATWPLLPEAISVVEAWGFTYKTIGFLWVKKNKSDCGHFFGLGRWTRGNSEVCLLATRGKPKRAGNAVSQLCFEPITRHSEKPAIIRERIVALLGDVPRIELFSRDRVAGWDAFGNEVESDVALASP